ncbi:MAG: hypothetical protein A2527_11810 [Candidatus Lambdaproteobacteria bacterium RIFOXYD2_FULL_50_16]|uniref:Major capsid protein E n=1 Tax=Candidatus Lambdaproteobacteria bacterium RIFOXYD2_FULL_50_16 TaxID=1817772 RepID=A0A1F6G660_9PROT|nr:MAG: hypothetical protein A2527_11810 [Candidatus Lambdaproteobacteria bacterium RIFOXYD2_FULL_50_16]
MDNLFSTRALTAAVNLIKPAPTLILDQVFAKKKRQLTDRFAWDVKSHSERVLKNIEVHEPAQVADNSGFKTITCRAPRFAEKRLINAHDLNAMRAFGEQANVELLKERIGQEQVDMKRKIDLTREFMAAKALSGQVVDDAGTVLVDYNFAAGQTPILTGTNLWTDAASSPLKNIRAWKKLISQEAGNVPKFVAFCGSDAMDALMSNQSALEMLKYTQGAQLAEQGRVLTFGGAEIHEYYGSYVDANNVRQDLIPADHFVLVGLADDAFAELTAPVVDFESEAGVGSGKPGEFFFSKSWKMDDPSGRWVKVEARPLPVLHRPECVVYAKVV